MPSVDNHRLQAHLFSLETLLVGLKALYVFPLEPLLRGIANREKLEHLHMQTFIYLNIYLLLRHQFIFLLTLRI